MIDLGNNALGAIIALVIGAVLVARAIANRPRPVAPPAPVVKPDFAPVLAELEQLRNLLADETRRMGTDIPANRE